jgi:bifunctional UDP-N-acetylglucosamine pyrophosphorylase/glucosamine-1-phosphate N-acetyltransferase
LEVPKVLISLKDKPIIGYLLESIAQVSYLDKPLVVVGFRHEEVEKALGQGYNYIFQPEQLGTAHAVLAAKSKIFAANLLVLHGDTPFINFKNMEELMLLHKHDNSPITMFTTRVPNFDGKYEVFKNFGRVIRRPDGSMEKIVEYADASEEEKKILELNPAVYIFKTEWLWDNLILVGNNNNLAEFYLTDIVEQAIMDNKPVSTLEVDPWKVLGINTPKDLAIAESLI